MAEKPILFNGAMVRAILDGRKTQTRRVIKPQPTIVPNKYDADLIIVRWEKNKNTVTQTIPQGLIYYNPYANEPGDVLWVRETWQAQSDCGEWWHEVVRDERDQFNWAWTNPVVPAYEKIPPRWLPSIHMPRAACRIMLEVMDVRVERVQDIDEAGAIADGVAPHSSYTAIGLFSSLWDKINAGRGYSWKSNPWVWVVEFGLSSS